MQTTGPKTTGPKLYAVGSPEAYPPPMIRTPGAEPEEWIREHGNDAEKEREECMQMIYGAYAALKNLKSSIESCEREMMNVLNSNRIAAVTGKVRTGKPKELRTLEKMQKDINIMADTFRDTYIPIRKDDNNG